MEIGLWILAAIPMAIGQWIKEGRKRRRMTHYEPPPTQHYYEPPAYYPMPRYEPPDSTRRII